MSLSDSRFNMWRGVVAFAHADGVVEDSERDFITKFFNTVAFTEDQKEQLLYELDHAQDINEIFPLITDKGDRGELILFARLMCTADGDFHEQEQEIVQIIHEDVLSKLDLDNIMHETDTMAEEARERRERLDEEAHAEARKKVGLGAVIRSLGDQVKGFVD